MKCLAWAWFLRACPLHVSEFGSGVVGKNPGLISGNEVCQDPWISFQLADVLPAEVHMHVLLSLCEYFGYKLGSQLAYLQILPEHDMECCLRHLRMIGQFPHCYSFVLIQFIQDNPFLGCNSLGFPPASVFFILCVAVRLLLKSSKPEADLCRTQGVVIPSCPDLVDGPSEVLTCLDTHFDHCSLLQSAFHRD